MRVLVASIDSDIGAEIAAQHTARGDTVFTTSRNGKGDFHVELLNFNTWLPGSELLVDRIYFTMGVNDDRRSRAEVMHINGFLSTDFIDSIARHLVVGGKFTVLTSGWGSVSRVLADNNRAYRMSKAALNMGVACLAKRYSKRNWLLMQPGMVRTKITAGIDEAKYKLIEASESAAGIIQVTDQEQSQFSFRDYQGNILTF